MGQVGLTPEDLTHLRRCVDLAEQAVEAGDEPFGSILVDEAGTVRFADHNRVSGGDHTQHPEFAVARWAAANLTPDERSAATVYTSGEHCPMCAAAHGWVGLGRIVYASSSEQLQQWRRDLNAPAGPVAALPIRAVVPGAKVDGPVPELADRLYALHARSLGVTLSEDPQATGGGVPVGRPHRVSEGWAAVDRLLIEQLVHEPAAAAQARARTAAAGLPSIEVSPTHGRMLGLLCTMSRATRVLEFGTLGGYSALWFADAVGSQGHVTTFELKQEHADVAAENLTRAGLADRVRIVVGPALQSVRALIDAGEPAYDLVFIDADKANNSNYLAAALELSHPGTVIVVDNVVRGGKVVDADSDDVNIRGAQAVLEAMGAHPRLTATAIQTVGLKGWDGFALGVVRGD
jgi:predicted O-methyltransferase YrrM/tRNA(Arg) A34 adenosine deaminase TadA